MIDAFLEKNLARWASTVAVSNYVTVIPEIVGKQICAEISCILANIVPRKFHREPNFETYIRKYIEDENTELAKTRRSPNDIDFAIGFIISAKSSDQNYIKSIDLWFKLVTTALNTINQQFQRAFREMEPKMVRELGAVELTDDGHRGFEKLLNMYRSRFDELINTYSKRYGIVKAYLLASAQNKDTYVEKFNNELLKYALINKGFPANVINLEISGRNAVETLSNGPEGAFLIRKSETSPATIIFNKKESSGVSNQRVQYNIKADQIIFTDYAEVFNLYLKIDSKNNEEHFEDTQTSRVPRS